MEVKFEIGKAVVTAGVAELMEEDLFFKTFIAFSLERHRRGLWGDICEEDALKYGDRLMSVYKTEGCPDIWIITESNRKITTVLFPHEY